jgi:hypothetical protein
MPTAHHTRRIQQQASAVDAIKRTLASIEAAQRQPDLWERVNLMCAIDLILRGAYSFVPAIVKHAMTPADQRVEIEPDSAYDICDLDFLRSELANAEAQPVRDHAVVAPWRDH